VAEKVVRPPPLCGVSIVPQKYIWIDAAAFPPFPSPPLRPFPSPSIPLHSFLLEVGLGPLKSIYGILRSAVSSPSGAWDGAPAEIDMGDILLICSAVQLPVCLMNLLTYLLTYGYFHKSSDLFSLE